MGTTTHVTHTVTHTVTGAVTALGAALLLVAGLGAAPSTAAARPFDGGRTAMQGAATAMGQTNSAVWALEIAGGRIHAGGNFTSTRPAGAAPGQRETGQAGLAAFDGATGAPVASFSPRLTKTVAGRTLPATVWATALSPDRSRLYVGGDFDRVDGRTARRLAVFDTRNGAFLGQVGSNGVDGTVTALAVSPNGDTLYVGGQFTQASNQTRERLAAFDVRNPSGGGLRGWAPQIGGQITNGRGQETEALRVVSLAVSDDGQRIFLAGPFKQVNGQDAQGFAATYSGNGARVPGFRDDYLSVPYGWGTVVEVAGDTVYLGGRDDTTSGPSRREGVYALDSARGTVRWYANCYGDTFGLQVLGSELYVASHAHDCTPAGGHPELSPRTYLAIHALNRTTGRVKPYFVQTAGQGNDRISYYMSRALATDGSQLVMGGGFARVNGRSQSNLTRFRRGSAAPERVTAPTVSTCRRCAAVQLRIRTAADRDDVRLRYEVLRGSRTTPIRRVTRESVLWRTGTITFRDRGLKRGQRVFYRVRVVDPAGSSRLSARSRTIRVGGGS